MITTLAYTVRSETTNNYIIHTTLYNFFFKLKYGLSNLILTPTGQKLIDWSLNLYMSLLLCFFLPFFQIQKNVTLYVFFALCIRFLELWSNGGEVYRR